MNKQCIIYQAGPKKNCTWEAFITSCCYLSWQLIRWYILLDEARSLQGDSMITGVWNREQNVFTWTEFHHGKFWKYSNLPHASFGWKLVKQGNILNSGCLSDSFLSATQTLHKNELSHDKNREILKAGRCSWMFWFVTARDAWEILLTRLASTQSETLKQREESSFNCSCVHVVKCECTSAGGISVYFQCWKISEINVAIIITRPVWLYLYF